MPRQEKMVRATQMTCASRQPWQTCPRPETAGHTSIRDDAAASECTGMLLARVERLGGGLDLGSARRGISASPAAAEPQSSRLPAGSSVASGMELALSWSASFSADRLRRVLLQRASEDVTQWHADG